MTGLDDLYRRLDRTCTPTVYGANMNMRQSLDEACLASCLEL